MPLRRDDSAPLSAGEPDRAHSISHGSPEKNTSLRASASVGLHGYVHNGKWLREEERVGTRLKRLGLAQPLPTPARQAYGRRLLSYRSVPIFVEKIKQ